mmetsp:Transcript_19049/g.39201  ORF Transcript_19049/g.39201 Transcript_19049/m.39201 type:complete len:86 (+) Transcript_19049:597-854(+)
MAGYESRTWWFASAIPKESLFLENNPIVPSEKAILEKLVVPTEKLQAPLARWPSSTGTRLGKQGSFDKDKVEASTNSIPRDGVNE